MGYDRERKVVVFSGTPSCTNKELYAEWRKAARQSAPGEAGFCTDCMPEYQEQMIAEGRCENPWIEFEYRESDELPPSILREEDRLIFSLSDKGITGYIPQSVKRGNHDESKER